MRKTTYNRRGQVTRIVGISVRVTVPKPLKVQVPRGLKVRTPKACRVNVPRCMRSPF